MGGFYRKKLTQNLKEKTAQGRGQELWRINLRITQGTGDFSAKLQNLNGLGTTV